MKKLVFLVLCLCFFQLYANANGYMGRKNMLKYEMGIWHPYAAGVLVPSIPIFHNCITFERTFKPGYAYGFVLSRMDMRDKLSQERLLDNRPLYAQTNISNWTTYSSSSSLEMNVKRSPANNKFNPQGGYLTVGVFLMYSHINTLSIRTEGGGYYSPYQVFVRRETFNQLDAGLALGFGRNMMLGSRLVLGTEFKVSLPFRSLAKIATRSQDYDVFERTALYNLLQLKINFGTIF